LTGSLRHLAPTVLVRLLSATSPSGVLELVTDVGSLRLEIFAGRVPVPTLEELRQAGRVLRCADGAFRFEPMEVSPLQGEALTLAAFAEAVQTVERGLEPSFASDVDLECLLSGEIVNLARPAQLANIHVLPEAPLEDPLHELLSDLEAIAPGELLLTQVVVVGQDPRLWRGSLESGWRRRGWQLKHYRSPAESRLDGLDVLILHQEHSLETYDQESGWLELVRRAAATEPPVPVIWIGRSTDLRWVQLLIEAGVGFVMPAPRGHSSDAIDRFSEALGQVVDRQLRLRQLLAQPPYPAAVCELVDTLLHGADSDRAVGSLLQLAAGDFLRGAVLMVEETAIRCRAGFGYPLNRNVTALPRGFGLLERAIRGAESIVGIDPDAGGARQLAVVLGVETLSQQTAVLPLGAGTSVGGLLVVDREGQPLPDLRDLALLACCLGGVAVRRGPGADSSMG
jgi:hypothetical protein